MLAPLVAVLLAVVPAAVPAPSGYTCQQVPTSSTSPIMVFTCTPSTEGAPVAAPEPVPVPVPAAPVAPAPSERIYVDPETPAAQQVRDWLSDGRTADAERLRKIADQPQPLWVGGSADDVEEQVSTYAQKAKAAGARPFYVGYNIPDRDCGAGYSGGGAGDAAGYRAWSAAFATGITGSDAIVVLEPDAIPHELQGGCGEGAKERYALLADAAEKLSAAGAAVYIDAGHPGFTGDVDATADALTQAGVGKAAGFSLNVSNFLSTDENVAYGTKISQKLGGTHFVIDTSRNGAPDDPPGWCNPPGRAIGQAPTLNPGIPLVDALLWVKRPGESDGDCGDGAPTAGEWFPSYALSLVS